MILHGQAFFYPSVSTFIIASIMKAIADYIINEGSISVTELNSIDTDLWRKAVKSFGIPALTAEMIDLSKFILKAA